MRQRGAANARPKSAGKRREILENFQISQLSGYGPQDRPLNGKVGVMSEKTAFRHRIFEANSTIFDEGDPAETVYVLRSGAVEIRIGTRGDYPRPLARVKVGDLFGELALLEDRSHEAAAIALEKSEVLEVPREEFMKRLNASDPVMKAVVNHLVSRLKEMTRELKN